MHPLARPTAFSYALFFVIFVLIGALHLTTPFLAVMFSYFALNRLNFARRKWLAILLFVVLIAVGSSCDMRRSTTWSCPSRTWPACAITS